MNKLPVAPETDEPADTSQNIIVSLEKKLEESSQVIASKTREIQQAKVELKESRKEIERIFDGLPLGYLSINTEGDIIAVNTAAEQIFQQDRGTLLNMPLTSFICATDQESYHRHQRMVKTRGGTHSVKITMLRGDGAFIRTRLESVSHPHENGRAKGFYTVISDISSKHNYKHLLRRTNTFQRTLIDSSPFAIISTDIKGIIQTINPSAERMFGYSADETTGVMTPLQFFLGKEIREAVRSTGNDENSLDFVELFNLPCFSNANKRNEWTYVRKGGDRFFMTISVAEVADSNGNPVGLIFEAIDITDRKLQESRIRKLNNTLQSRIVELHQEKNRAHTTLMSISDGVIITGPTGQVEIINPTACRLTGYEESYAIGKEITQILPLYSENRKSEPSAIFKCIETKMPITAKGAKILTSTDGTPYNIEKSVAPVLDESGEVLGVVVVFRDVTHSIRMINKMIYQATHDELTGLINRREFNRCLEKALDGFKYGSISAVDAEPGALLVLDLDRFKAVNDTCGHAAGDELLRQLSVEIKDKAGADSVVARMGGDEFAVLFEGISFESVYNKAMEILTGIQNHLFIWDSQQFRIGASIGIKMLDTGINSIINLQSEADAAAYAAKRAGRNRIHIFGEDSETFQIKPSLCWFNRINKALEDNQLMLFSQSIQPINNHQKHFTELLLRMRTPDQGIVLPGEFIPAAERYNLMPAIDRWVVECAFSWLAHHRNAYIESEWFSINLSGPSLSEDSFYVFLKQQFEKWRIPYEKICFEITETLGILNISRTFKLMESLQKLGCRFSLDDFGSGFSSYETLKQLPVDYIKIDGSFVRDSVNNPIDMSIVRSIQDIGTAMGKKTIAEYVENREILTAMQDIGVDYVQGYYFDKPMRLLDWTTGHA